MKVPSDKRKARNKEKFLQQGKSCLKVFISSHRDLHPAVAFLEPKKPDKDDLDVYYDRVSVQQ